MKNSRAKAKPKTKAKKVKLSHAGVVHVKVPKGVVPIVATDHAKGIVTIIPVKQEKLQEKSWLYRLFG